MYYTYQDPHEIRRQQDIETFNPSLEKLFARDLSLVCEKKLGALGKEIKKKKKGKK